MVSEIPLAVELFSARIADEERPSFVVQSCTLTWLVYRVHEITGLVHRVHGVLSDLDLIVVVSLLAKYDVHPGFRNERLCFFSGAVLVDRHVDGVKQDLN